VTDENVSSRSASRRRLRAAARTYTIKEAAQILGIGRNQGYAAAHAGDIPTIRIGQRLLVPRDALHRLLAGRAPS
jgi:excisionase family DNA binding protein